MKCGGSKIVAIIEMASRMTKKFVWVEVDPCQLIFTEAIVLTVCNMFTLWSYAWKNGEIFFEKMFTGIIVVCCYHIFKKLCLLQGGEENVFILCRDVQNHIKVDKSESRLK